MKKRLLATALWFYATWYAWSILADVTGMPVAFGVVTGLMVAAFVGMDPMHRIWTKRPASTATKLPALEPETA